MPSRGSLASSCRCRTRATPFASRGSTASDARSRAAAWRGWRAIPAPAATRAAWSSPRATSARELGRELIDLGRRACATLEIARPHPEIVDLVGRLNYRTSFTQNQWKHAVEAAFLCGMMAQEMGLDLKLARRAALMHDIGKALTHEMDGSHAVIGADIARRLGEPEMVANAIGAHHTDEPFNSPYAYLVAAADAMSGARPGARRQMEDNYVAKLEDLERITRSFRGIEEAFAVQGGREVRIYVQEDRVDDLAGREPVRRGRPQDLRRDDLPRPDPRDRHPRIQGHRNSELGRARDRTGRVV